METILNKLRSVLCDPEGKCCISGSDADRTIVDEALAVLATQPLEQKPLYSPIDDDAKPEQVAQDGARLDWLEQVGAARLQRMRRMDPKAPKYWDVEYGADEDLATGPTLRDAIDAARASGKGG